MQKKQFSGGHTIFSEGENGNDTYIIQSGEVLIYKDTRNGRLPVGTLSHGDIFGEMYLLDYSGKRNATAIAQNGVVVDVVTKEKVEEYLHKTPIFILSILKSMSQRLATITQRYSQLRVNQQDNPNWYSTLGQWLLAPLCLFDM